jgi:hypothetical protein
MGAPMCDCLDRKLCADCSEILGVNVIDVDSRIFYLSLQVRVRILVRQGNGRKIGLAHQECTSAGCIGRDTLCGGFYGILRKEQDGEKHRWAGFVLLQRSRDDAYFGDLRRTYYPS